MIFYFSGTGNTLWVAQQLAIATNERLVAIANCFDDASFTLAPDERIGFCFPVHGWKPPRIVRQFVSRLHIANAEGHFCYALVTCGDSVGKAIDILNDDLRQCGLTVESMFSLIMPESYVVLPFMYTDSEEREWRKLRTAERQIKTFCDDIVQRRRGLRELTTGPVPWVLSHVIGTVFNGVLITDKPFKVDATKCTGCTTCQHVCPVGNIAAERGKQPTWLHNHRCTACLACYHHCPHHAISYGPLTNSRGQYYYGKR